MNKVPGSEEFYPAELCFLCLGFLGPEDAALKTMGIEQVSSHEDEIRCLLHNHLFPVGG